MPARSKLQYKFFKYLEENPKEAQKKGVSQSLAHEYTDPITKDKWKNLKTKLTKKK